MSEAKAFGNARPPAIGEVIAEKYRVESIVGTGGMGIVLGARHLQLGQTVAIKVLSAPEESRRDEANKRFIREAQAAAGLRSDHVVRIYDVGTLESGLPFMVMELLRGADLGTVLDTEIKLDQVLAVDLVLQACDAIAEAHQAGIVHRDLKPSNLFVTGRSDGQPLLKVLDFGISKTMASKADSVEGTLTSTRAVMGSPYYMSPEQVRDARRVDGRSDIWALGVILHEALTGEPAFQADTFPGVCAAIVADPPTPVHVQRPDVSPELEAVVMRCLEKDVARRFQTVSDLVGALLPFSSRTHTSSGRLRSGGRLPSAVQRGDALSSGRSAAQGASAQNERVPSASFIEGATLSYDDARQEARSKRVITGDTKTQLSADLLPESGAAPAPVTGKRRWPLYAALGGTAILAGLMAVGLGGSSDPAAPPVVATKPPPPAPAAEPFALSVESTPPGAQVFEGAASLGVTPMTVTLVLTDPAKPRLLVLRKPGYKPYSLEQGPARGEVRVHVVLVPEAPAEPQPAVAASAALPAPLRPAPRSAVSKKTAPKADPSAPAGDIRLQR